MNQSYGLDSVYPSLQGISFGYEEHQIVNSHHHPSIDPETGCIYILDDVSCNAKIFSFKIFDQDLKFVSSFDIPKELHTTIEDKGWASFGVSRDFIYFLNRTKLCIVGKKDFNTITHTTVSKRNDSWHGIYVGDYDNICLHRQKRISDETERLDLLIFADYVYSIRRDTHDENFMTLVSMTRNSVLLKLKPYYEPYFTLLEISHDGKDICSINFEELNDSLCMSIGSTYILLLTTECVLTVFSRDGKKRSGMFLEYLQTEDIEKIHYMMEYDEKTNALFLYSPFTLSHLFVKFHLTDVEQLGSQFPHSNVLDTHIIH